jgi:hypothetical protein
MMSFRQFLRILNPPYLDEVFLTMDGTTGRCLSEGKWTDGRFKDNIRIDRATHLLSGDPHAHVYGRKGQLVGVRILTAQRATAAIVSEEGCRSAASARLQRAGQQYRRMDSVRRGSRRPSSRVAPLRYKSSLFRNSYRPCRNFFPISPKRSYAQGAP